MAEKRPSPSDVIAIGERLKLSRLAVGKLEGDESLSKADFAERAGLKRTTYANYEPTLEGGPPVGRPSIDQADLLCEKYHLTLDWIYKGDRSRLPHELVEAIEAVEQKLAKQAAQPAPPAHQKRA